MVYEDMVDLMRTFDSNAVDVPQLGIFWFLPESGSLFEVHTEDFDSSKVVNGHLSYGKLHKNWWAKVRMSRSKGSNPIYQTDYTMIPRGRVSFDDGRFVVYVGSWYAPYESLLRDLIVDEFNIPYDFEFCVKEHWDIGHGFNELL